jgi:hypothetical protein
MQLIFDESQKGGAGEIWINVYNIIELLKKNRVTVYRDSETKDYNRLFDIEVPGIHERIDLFVVFTRIKLRMVCPINLRLNVFNL